MKKLTDIQERVLIQLRRTHPAPDTFVQSLDKTLWALEKLDFVTRSGTGWSLTLAGVNHATREAFVREHASDVWHRVDSKNALGDLLCGRSIPGSPIVRYAHEKCPSPETVCGGCRLMYEAWVLSKTTPPTQNAPAPEKHPPEDVEVEAAINAISEANKPLCGIMTWDHSACERARGHKGDCDSSPRQSQGELMRHLRAMYAALRRAQLERDEAPEAVCKRILHWMADPKRAPSSTFSDTPEGTVMLGIELMLKDKAEATRRGVRDDGVMPREEAVRFLSEKARAAEGLPPLLSNTPTAYMLAGCPAGNPECPAERMPVEVNFPAWTVRETCPVCRAPDRRTRATL